MENYKGLMSIFSKIEDESNKLDGMVSMLFAVEEALMYGANDPKEYTGAISLLCNLLDDYKEMNKELIDNAVQMTRAIK